MDEWKSVVYRLMRDGEEPLVVKGWHLRGIGLVGSIDRSSSWIVFHVETDTPLGTMLCDTDDAKAYAGAICHLTNWEGIKTEEDMKAEFDEGLASRLENLLQYIRGEKHAKAGRA